MKTAELDSLSDAAVLHLMEAMGRCFPGVARNFPNIPMRLHFQDHGCKEEVVEVSPPQFMRWLDQRFLNMWSKNEHCPQQGQPDESNSTGFPRGFEDGAKGARRHGSRVRRRRAE